MAAVQTAGPVLRLTLERGTWYGLTMYPGYGDGPYHSPIRVDDIKPQGQRLFKLSFLNLGYAAGGCCQTNVAACGTA